MGNRLRWIGRRMAGLGTGFMDAFLRENKVLPPVLAAMAVFVVAWLLAGMVLGGGDERGADQRPVAHKADLAQSDDAPGPEPVDPDVENRDVDSYAAYRSKDPFREVLAPAETTSEQTTSRPAPEDTTGPERTQRTPAPGNRVRNTDGDGIPDRRERTRGTDPNNPDTDDGRPAGGATGTGGVPNAGRADAADDRDTSRGGGLLNSGGILPLP